MRGTEHTLANIAATPTSAYACGADPGMPAASPAATAELDRQLRLSEAVMRTKVLRAEEAVARLSGKDDAAEASESRKAG